MEPVDWRTEGKTPIPGVTMGNLTVVKRDYPHHHDMFTAVGPLLRDKGRRAAPDRLEDGRRPRDPRRPERPRGRGLREGAPA